MKQLDPQGFSVVNIHLEDGATIKKLRLREKTGEAQTYVAPHKKTDPDKTETDNWGYKGNSNP